MSEASVVCDRIRTHLQFGLRPGQTWVEAVELERTLDAERVAVERAMGHLERQFPELEREERAGELRWRLPRGMHSDGGVAE